MVSKNVLQIQIFILRRLKYDLEILSCMYSKCIIWYYFFLKKNSHLPRSFQSHSRSRTTGIPKSLQQQRNQK